MKKCSTCQSVHGIRATVAISRVKVKAVAVTFLSGEVRQADSQARRRKVNLTMELVGVILAGGSAARLGGLAKGLLSRSNGPPIAVCLSGQMLAAGVGEVVIVCNNPGPYEHMGLKILPDIRPGQGPMGGIETGLPMLPTGPGARCFCRATCRQLHAWKSANSSSPGEIAQPGWPGPCRRAARRVANRDTPFAVSSLPRTAKLSHNP